MHVEHERQHGPAQEEALRTRDGTMWHKAHTDTRVLLGISNCYYFIDNITSTLSY